MPRQHHFPVQPGPSANWRPTMPCGRQHLVSNGGDVNRTGR